MCELVAACRLLPSDAAGALCGGQGKRKYNQRNDKRAAREFRDILTCGVCKSDVAKERARLARLFPSQGEASRYVGATSANGAREGTGVERFADGTVYEGGYVGGLKHGVGKMAFADGSEHVGSYANGVREGAGTYRFADGRALVGTFAADARQLDVRAPRLRHRRRRVGGVAVVALGRGGGRRAAVAVA